MEGTLVWYQGKEGDFDTFVRIPEEIPEGEIIELMIREIPRYRSRVVKARIFKKWDKGKTGNKLYPLTPLGKLHPGAPWAIEIIELLDDNLMGQTHVQRCIFRER